MLSMPSASVEEQTTSQAREHGVIEPALIRQRQVHGDRPSGGELRASPVVRVSVPAASGMKAALRLRFRGIAGTVRRNKTPPEARGKPPRSEYADELLEQHPSQHGARALEGRTTQRWAVNFARSTQARSQVSNASSRAQGARPWLTSHIPAENLLIAALEARGHSVVRDH